MANISKRTASATPFGSKIERTLERVYERMRLMRRVNDCHLTNSSKLGFLNILVSFKLSVYSNSILRI